MPQRRLSFLSLFAAGLALLITAVAPDRGLAADGINLSEEDRQIFQKVSAYLNSLKSVKGRFTQVGPNGELTEGTFYLVRPGRIRFDYADPNPILVVADGSWVGIEDRKLRTVEKYPLAATPLRLLLAEEVNLLEDARVVGFESPGDLVMMTLEDPRGTAPGQLTLILEGENPKLKQWVVTDAQGLRTEVSLFDMVTDATLSRKLFYIDDSTLYETGNKY